MTAENATFTLPPAIRTEECEALHAFLLEHHHEGISIDCASVDRIGGQAAQLIAAHMKFRAETATPLHLENPSEGFVAALALMDLADLVPDAGDAA